MKKSETAKGKAAEKDDPNEDKYRMLASMAFMIVVIIIGVPMWWKTTEVYRVVLPSSEILSVSDHPIRISAKIGIFTFDQQRSKLIINELYEAFRDNELWHLNFENILVTEKMKTVKTPAGLEALILNEFKLNAGDFVFIEWPKLQEEILLTTERTAFIRSDTSGTKIKNVLSIALLQTHRIQHAISEERRHAVNSEATQIDYDVIVSVLNPRPDVMNVKWNVKKAVDTYIAPFLNEISQISNYTLKTQWRYQVKFEAELQQKRDNTKIGRHYALQESSLPHIITSIEKDLGVGITDKAILHLVVYIPPCEIAPIHIYNRYNKQATRHQVDSFISPKWGGIIIANPPLETCLIYNNAPQPIEFYVNTNDVMQIMLYQLHKLLDIHTEFNIPGVKTVELEQIAPHRWEYDAYIRRNTIKHIATTTNTLQSLIKLLDNISYIVINDNVGAAVHLAFHELLLAREALANGQLILASDYAKSAFIASEQAFFDSSLLAQLYFPDEQKYAIYIPLFLPIMVPVITSLSMIRKFLKKLKDGKKSKSN